MDWATYKSLCNRPDYWSAWMLEQCEELFLQLREKQLLDDLHRARAATPLPLPDGHSGDSKARMFQLSLPAERRRRMLQAVVAASSQGVTTSGTHSRGLGGFVEAWREFADYSP